MMSSIYLRSLFKYEPSLMALMGRCIYLQGTKIHCRSLPVCHYHFKLMKKEPKVGGAWEWHQDYGY